MPKVRTTMSEATDALDAFWRARGVTWYVTERLFDTRRIMRSGAYRFFDRDGLPEHLCNLLARNRLCVLPRQKFFCAGEFKFEAWFDSKLVTGAVSSIQLFRNGEEVALTAGNAVVFESHDAVYAIAQVTVSQETWVRLTVGGFSGRTDPVPQWAKPSDADPERSDDG